MARVDYIINVTPAYGQCENSFDILQVIVVVANIFDILVKS